MRVDCEDMCVGVRGRWRVFDIRWKFTADIATGAQKTSRLPCRPERFFHSKWAAMLAGVIATVGKERHVRRMRKMLTKMKISSLGAVLFGLAFIGCMGMADRLPESSADIVFLGENILTVDPNTPKAEAVAVLGETIVAVGDRREVAKWIGKQTRVIELGDRALIPGFIDAHGHLSLVMQLLDLLNASSPPVGPMQTIEDVVQGLRDRIAQQQIPDGEFVMGYGYDDSLLAEGRHPNRDDLDRASSKHPIGLMHVSGHLATMNSAALAVLGIDATTPNPPGGVIRRRAGSREPNGVLEETAAIAALTKLAGAGPSPEEFASAVFRAIAYHARYGVTTIQDGASNPRIIAGLRAVAVQRPFPVDVAIYVQSNGLDDETSIDSLGFSTDYVNGVRVAGAKFVLDGSPQGRTAWLTRPYDQGPPGVESDYTAYPIIEPDQYKRQVSRLIRGGIPILAHANGDAAIDLMIEGVRLAVGDEDLDHRSVAIHAQLAREDQLDEMKRLGIVPSFFAAHPYFWGDWHRLSFGDDRALRISPLRSAILRDLPFTIHNDAPIVPANMMRLLEIAIERRTRDGFILGADQRISFDEALHSVTLGAAYAYFEEDRKGSISVGKQADLVILGANPRKVAPQDVGEIDILETFAHGRSIFALEAADGSTPP
jgi:predicted amidohydrolase YtcJ